MLFRIIESMFPSAFTVYIAPESASCLGAGEETQSPAALVFSYDMCGPFPPDISFGPCILNVGMLAALCYCVPCSGGSIS